MWAKTVKARVTVLITLDILAILLDVLIVSHNKIGPFLASFS